MIIYENPISKELGEPIRITYDSGIQKIKMNNAIHYRIKQPSGLLGWLTPRTINYNNFPIIGTEFIFIKQ